MTETYTVIDAQEGRVLIENATIDVANAEIPNDKPHAFDRYLIVPDSEARAQLTEMELICRRDKQNVTRIVARAEG